MDDEMQDGNEDAGDAPGRNEDGDDVVEWWLLHAPDPDDTDALAARINKAILDARNRERDFWTEIKMVPPPRKET